ncbi:MAG TPA: endonuclease III [Candidatus Cloacimonadota bacterium]|nr:endonuclease III [Candidatus Cloacimonadota bacterium]
MPGHDIDAIIAALGKHFLSVRTPIVDLVQAQTNDPFKVLVATILSARTKDETTAQAVTKLFRVVESPADLDQISDDELDSLIYQVGFHREKTKHLKQLPHALNTLFDGRIPHEIDDLIKLPGVGRKTANLVRSIAFGLPAICVDVHVHRICNRWGYVRTNTPFETEMELRRILPAKHWAVINSYVVAFGQSLCTPLNPKCSICPIQDHCRRVGVGKSS